MIGFVGTGRAQPPAEPLSATRIFDQPFVYKQLSEVMPRGLQLGRAGRVEQMAEIMTGLTEKIPDHPVPFYNLACAQARLSQTNEALESLSQAVTLGLTAVDQIAGDPDFASIRALPEFTNILARAASVQPFTMTLPSPVPVAASNGVVTVQASNTGWDPRRAMLFSLFSFPDQPPATDAAVIGNDPARTLVRQWHREGSAAGNFRDLYDNRDGGHSTMKYGQFPLLNRVTYGPEAQKRKLHWGPQTMLLYNAVTLGNASVAATGGPGWGSMARHIYVNPRSMAALHTQYRANHLYLYPEHKDHDIGHNGTGGGHGDVFSVNSPYVIISQGSSGSDKRFLDALTLCLAAFQPASKQKLAEQGLLMPTLQMILRRCGKQIQSAGDYLSGAAHPTVFDARQLDPERMVRLAHAITPDALPPLASVKVIEEDPARPGLDYFHHIGSEVICTTPGAIARVARSLSYTRRMVVSAEDSIDASGRALSYHWRVLRGDTDRIRINPLNEDATRVELIIPYHERFPVAPGSKLESTRVDIGAFVHNGDHYSAPAFISIFYLDNEQRVYDEAQQIQSVQYSGAATPGNYVDPRIDVPKDWHDAYHYDPSGTLTGWTRSMLDGSQFVFSADGTVRVAEEEAGAASGPRTAVYPAVRHQDGRAILAQVIVERQQPASPGDP